MRTTVSIWVTENNHPRAWQDSPSVGSPATHANAWYRVVGWALRVHCRQSCATPSSAMPTLSGLTAWAKSPPNVVDYRSASTAILPTLRNSTLAAAILWLAGSTPWLDGVARQ
jgi:hypothetical protein